MKLEAIDPEHQSLICVVSVAEVQGPRYDKKITFARSENAEDFVLS